MPERSPTRNPFTQPGILAALGAALLFGAGTPLAKLLLHTISPWLMAALLYLGSGLGLGLFRLLKRTPSARLQPGEWRWLAAAIFIGGVLGPGLQMLGLTRMPASGASLLLNAESVFTALLAWFVFKENFDRRIALGMAAILVGLVLLTWPGHATFAGVLPALCILGACFCWAVDNNLTRKVSLSDATFIACLKGLVAGSVNLAIAFALGAVWPTLPHIAAAMLLGLFAYGISLALFVLGLRHLGTARTGAYFAIAPFFGALLAILLLHERLTLKLSAAAALMALGLWLHLSENHVHRHQHTALDHEHEHTHDGQDQHHQHDHPYPVAPGITHTHPHHHQPLNHTHPHFPDAHHQHTHDPHTPASGIQDQGAFPDASPPP